MPVSGVGWDPTGDMAEAKERRLKFIDDGGYAAQRRASMSGGGGGSSGSGFTQKAPTGSTQITRSTITPPSMPAPTLGPAPEFQLPQRDEARIRRLQQEAAAPYVREKRRATRQALLRHLHASPSIRKELERGALAGLGEGLSKVMGAARREGRAQYEAEYAPQVEKARAEFGARQQDRIVAFTNAWQSYMRQFGKSETRTTKNIYGSSTGGARTVSVGGSFGPLLTTRVGAGPSSESLAI